MSANYECRQASTLATLKKLRAGSYSLQAAFGAMHVTSSVAFSHQSVAVTAALQPYHGLLRSMLGPGRRRLVCNSCSYKAT